MPIYEYRCQSCGHEIEKLQRMNDPAPTDCPDCGKAELRRKISAAGFRLKGSGWYETDFKQGNKRNLADSPSDKPASSSGATGTESKKESGVKKESSGSSSDSTKSSGSKKTSASSSGDSASS